MVSGTSLFLGLFNNLAFFIVLVAVYGVLIRYLDKSTLSIRQGMTGLVFGILAIACMHVKIPVAEGVIVDQRNTVVALSGAFGGPLSAVLCALMTGAYRIFLGGAGAFAGAVGVGLAALAGTFFFKLRHRVDSVFKAALSALAATIIILPGFLLYKDLSTGWELLKAMALPYGAAVYIGILFVGFLLSHQENSHLAQMELKRSAKRLRESGRRLNLALDGANEGIWDWDLESDTLVFDSRYYTIAGYTPYEFPAALEEWEKRVHPDDIHKTNAAIQQYLSGNLVNFDVEFRFLRKDGCYMWIQGRGKIVARKENGDPTRFTGTHADITQRKKAEESLLITQFSIDRANIGIYRIASDAQILEVNDKAAQMIGHTKAELAAMSIVDIDPNITMENWAGIWQQLLDKGVDKFETTHQTKDDLIMPVEILSNLLEYDGRKYSICFVQDISERKEMEKVLLESKERYQALHEASFGGVFIHDQGIVLDCNQGLSKITDYTHEELIGMDALNTLIAPDWRKTVLHNIKSSFTQPYEVEGIRKDGSIYPLYVQGKDIPYKGRTVRVVEYRDISKLKQAEEELRKLRNYLSNIINSMPSVLVGVDHEGRVTQWNQQAERVTGLLFDKVVSRPLDSMFPGLASQMDDIKTAIHNRQVIYTPKVPQHEGSETRYEDITIYPLVANGVEGAVIRVDNVTKEYKLEMELRHSHKMDAIGQLAGGVAHDFNNMLAGINGASDLLEITLAENKSAMQYIDIIKNATERAAGLTRKLLAFSRKNSHVSTAVNLTEIIKDVVAILKRSIDKRIVISTDFNASETMVSGDPSQLQSGILNLCVNARDAMPEGGKLHISTTNTYFDEEYCEILQHLTPGNYVQASISDTGTGIPPEVQPHIFEPFYTTKDIGKGTGLGLAAVYGMVKDHRGDIRLYSEVGTGSVFHIYLPAASEIPFSVQDKKLEVIRGQGTILVVEDEEIIRATASLLLENMGYNVLFAKNGLEGVNIYKDKWQTIDLIILDMIMPVMNGREAFEEILTINPEAKVVLASGFARNVDTTKMEDKGLAGYIMKPFNRFELSKLIFDILQRTT